MMGTNESEALKTIRSYEQIIREHTKAFHGEIVNFYGDGSLAMFESIISALDCSVEIQKACSKDIEVPLRIGIHIGEILIQDDNIYGDAVNLISSP